MCLAVSERVNSQLMSHDAGRLFAVVHAAGKQRKVTVEDVILLDKHIAADVGQRIRLNKVVCTLPITPVNKHICLFVCRGIMV